MDNLRGAILMVLAMLGFAIEDSFIKMMGTALPVGQILTLLGLGGAAVFALIVLAQGRALFERAMLAGPVLTRAGGEIFGTVCFISAIVFTPLSTIVPLLLPVISGIQYGDGGSACPVGGRPAPLSPARR